MFLDPSTAMCGADSELTWGAIHECFQRFEECADRSHVSTRKLAQLCWQDIQVDSLLGSGGFSDVYKVRVRHPGLDRQHYALKCSNENSMKHFERDFATSNAVNLALEAAILSSLHHENIISLQGTNSVSDPCANRGYFLILEVLEETLQDRFVRLRSYSPNPFSSLKKAASILERIESCALGIACGMEYLHQNEIILRDLKPENIGFDASENVKLFDFGMARHLQDISEQGIAGSLRYMAPETVLAIGSNAKSDVYSFGVLMWELCTLRKPFEKFRTKSQFKDKVVVGKYRPPVKGFHSFALERIVSESWSYEPENRPTFSKIRELLGQAIAELTSRRQRKIPFVGKLLAKKPSSYWKHNRSIPLPPDLFDDNLSRPRSTFLKPQRFPSSA